MDKRQRKTSWGDTTLYKIIILLLASTIITNTAHPQTKTDSLLTQYPLRVGNVWDYTGTYYYSGVFPCPRWKTVTAIDDSVHINGKQYIVLETTYYEMELQSKPGTLGRISKFTSLQRVDSTSLNVYEIVDQINQPWEDSTGIEYLIDSLNANMGDSIDMSASWGEERF